MKEYRTQQRRCLFEFLMDRRDRQFTVEEIAQSIKGVSISAIYRNINQLVSEGSVRRFQQEGSRKFLYQYLGGGDCTAHLHLKCEKCGSMFHLDTEFTEALVKLVNRGSYFNLDRSRTILYGACAACK